MATTTKNPTTAAFEPTAERFAQLNERLVEEGRKVSLSAVDAYEKAGWGVAEYQARVAKASQVDWLTSLLDAQADFTRTIVSAQTSAARSVLS